MTFEDVAFWKIVCLILFVACFRVNCSNFLIGIILLAFVLQYFPPEEPRDSHAAVSARQTKVENSTIPDKVQNWRKKDTLSSAPSRPTPGGQPSPEQRKRLMETLYNEMNSK
jgi:hypothetical protein